MPPSSRSVLCALPLLLLFLFLLHPCAAAASPHVAFTDVSAAAGISRAFGRRIKYGGAALADLDGDGWVDLLCAHHDSGNVQVYFNARNGTFIQPTPLLKLWRDTHALTPIRLSPNQRALHFLLSRGGGNGLNPNPPQLFRVDAATRRVVDVTAQAGLLDSPQAEGRGRSVLFTSLRRTAAAYSRYPDALVLNAEVPESQKKSIVDSGGKSLLVTLPHEKLYTISPPNRFTPRNFTAAADGSSDFGLDAGQYATVTDIDNDGVLEVVSWHKLQLWNVSDDFQLTDITRDVFPPGLPVRLVGVVSVAELDYDNDGRWDLFVTASATGETKWISKHPQRRWVRDYLFRNVGGRYVDVSARAGVETSVSTRSRGATVGDVDNDGFVDIIVSRYEKYDGGALSDVVYRNLGNGSFETVDAGFDRAVGVAGDMPSAVDYDRDGRVDVVVSQGDWFNKSAAGFYHLFRNIAETGHHWLLVRVRNAPGRAATSLHAVVRVYVLGYRAENGRWKGRKMMMRRVGSPGTSVSNSYVEVLHFGLGEHRTIANVTVTWGDGTTRWRRGVTVNRTIAFGV